MKIVINSHINSNIAIEHLLESMKMYEGFNDFEIIIITGGYYDNKNYEVSKDGNITYIKCNHNSIDFTGLITLLELYSDNIDEYYMYIHDTCKIGSNFYNKIKSINLTNVSSIKINKGYSMNIGIYSQKLINNFKDFLLSKRNTDKDKCIDFKVNNNEDYIFNNDPNNYVLDNFQEGNYIGPIDYYNTGTMRIILYYPNIDLYKMKANWGANGWNHYVCTLKN